MSNDVRAHLLGSQAVRSLIGETRVSDALKVSKWEVSHSCYYRDLSSHKAREIEVVASKRWNARDDDSSSVSVNLVIECKTNPGYNIIAASSSRSAVSAALERVWVVETDRLPLVLQAARNAGILYPTLNELRKAIIDTAFDDARPSFEVRPPDAAVHASAFVETNGGTTRELETSVLWRAVQALGSAVASLKAQWIDDMVEEIQVHRIVNEFMGDEPFDRIREYVVSRDRHHKFFHPFVFIESPLWVLKGSDLEQTSSIRLQFQNAPPTSLSWVDVVAMH